MDVVQFLDARTGEDEAAAERADSLAETTRLRAEAEAKRTLIDELTTWRAARTSSRPDENDEEVAASVVEALTNVAAAFAAVYRDHPDYQSEWG